MSSMKLIQNNKNATITFPKSPRKINARLVRNSFNETVGSKAPEIS
jgi:hypothetical protein